MPLMDFYPPGTFCWVDLVAGDIDAAERFYTELFGWGTTAVPGSDVGSYTLLRKGDKTVAALSQMNPEMRNEGVPSHWRSYISVEDVEAAAEKADGLGANVLTPPFDAMGAGRAAEIEDPTGARFVLWEPNELSGAELVNESGSWCWNELHTNDVRAAEQFYADLFAWDSKPDPGGASDLYIEFQNGPRAAGGMLEIQPSWGEAPPNWIVYFAVDDLNGAVAKVEELGGKAPMTPIEIPKIGRFALVHDHGDAPFALIQLAEGAVERSAE